MYQIHLGRLETLPPPDRGAPPNRQKDASPVPEAFELWYRWYQEY